MIGSSYKCSLTAGNCWEALVNVKKLLGNAVQQVVMLESTCKCWGTAGNVVQQQVMFGSTCKCWEAAGKSCAAAGNVGKHLVMLGSSYKQLSCSWKSLESTCKCWEAGGNVGKQLEMWCSRW